MASLFCPGLECLLLRCPREAAAYLPQILRTAAGFIKYDPNFSYEDEDEDGRMQLEGMGQDSDCDAAAGPDDEGSLPQDQDDDEDQFEDYGGGSEGVHRESLRQI